MKAVKRKEQNGKKKGKEVDPAFYMIRGVRRYIGIGVRCPREISNRRTVSLTWPHTHCHTSSIHTVPIIAHPHPATGPGPALLQPWPVRQQPVPSSGVAGRWAPPVGTPPYCSSRPWPPFALARRSCSCCKLPLQLRRGHRRLLAPVPELEPALEPEPAPALLAEPHERAAADDTVPASRGSSSL